MGFQPLIFNGIIVGSSGGGGGGSVNDVTATSPLFSSGGSSPNITIQVADTGQDGYLTAVDWNTFNNKQDAGSYANTTLSNLGVTSINASLIPSTDNNKDLGTALLRYGSVFTSTINSGSGTLSITGSGVQVNGLRIQSVGNPSSAQDAVTLTYLQTNFPNVTLAAVGSSPNANAASLSGQALNLQPFDGTHPGVVTASGGGTSNFLRADGSWASPPSGSPGGSDTNVQFNDSGSFGGTSDLTFDKTNVFLGVGQATPQAKIHANSGVTSGTVGTDVIILGLPDPGNNIGNGSLIANGFGGNGNIASGQNAAAFGDTSSATGNNSLVAGFNANASSGNSMAFGQDITASGPASFAVNRNNIASGFRSFASGFSTTASGAEAASFGLSTQATGTMAFSHGRSSSVGTLGVASGNASHSEGIDTVASGVASHSDGLGTVAQADNQLAVGQYNIPVGTPTSPASTDEIFTVGNGANSGSLATAFSVRRDGLIDAHSHLISNVADPVSAQDAATKAFVLANSGTGTVTAVSVASANGFAGSSTGGATPALTISTSITGVLKGNGTAISAATAGTDYSAGTAGNITGIVKSTTGTGALTTAIASDFPTLNQNTTGSAATLTTPRNINGVSFNGSADITVTAAAGTLTGTTLNSTVVTSSLTSVGTISTGTWSGTTIALNKGGTGQVTKAAAFDALSPMTTGGDIIYGGASGTGTRLANGSSGQVLTSSGTTSAPTWTTPLSNPLNLPQVSTPSNPSSGFDKLYFKNDNNLYSLDSSGNERLVGPGMVGSDWIDETANFTPSPGFGAITNLAVFSRRVGDTKQVRGAFIAGTCAPSSAYILLPVSAQLNSAKVTSTRSGLGFIYGLDPAGTSDIIGNNGLADIIYYDGSNTDRLLISRNSTSSDIKPMNVNGAYADTSGFTFEFSYPVSGWSANNGPGRSGFQFYASSQVTTSSSSISAASFTTFDNSPAFTFTPTISGTYKVYSSVPLEQASLNVAAGARIIDTTGSPTLLQESQGTVYLGQLSTGNVASVLIQSIYTLTASVSYTFDIQGQTVGTNGTVYIRGDYAPFYMFAELCG